MRKRICLNRSYLFYFLFVVPFVAVNICFASVQKTSEEIVTKKGKVFRIESSLAYLSQGGMTLIPELHNKETQSGLLFEGEINNPEADYEGKRLSLKRVKKYDYFFKVGLESDTGDKQVYYKLVPSEKLDYQKLQGVEEGMLYKVTGQIVDGHGSENYKVLEVSSLKKLFWQ